MRARKETLVKLAILIALLAALCILPRSIANQTRTRIADCYAPLLGAGQAVIDSITRILPFAAYREENRRLNEKIAFLRRQITESKSLAIENARLKELLAFKKDSPYQLIPALVIGRDPSNWSGSIIIDKGATGGIGQNKAVIATRGLVGRTLEIGRSSAKILLISDPNSKVAVVIQRSGQGGILTGRPDGRCKMIYIALDADVAPGDKVVTAGYGSIYPKDILVGTVVRVDREPGRLYKNALVRPAQNMTKLREVLCLK